MVVTELFKAGDHVPVMPLLEMVGNAFNVPPAHMGGTGSNDGVVKGGSL